MSSHLRTLYWFACIKLVRALIALRLPSAAEFVGTHSGLRRVLTQTFDLAE
jgi:hypothetical protein